MSSMSGRGMATGSSSRIGGTGYNQVNIPADPRTQELWEQIRNSIGPGIGAGGDFLSQMAMGGSPEMWEQIEAPALRQFGQAQGNTASRFSGMGSGARRSSGFQNVMGAQAQELAERLQSNRMGLRMNAIKDLMGMSQNLLGTSLSDSTLVPKEKPWWQEFLSGLGGVAGQAAGTFGGIGAGKWAGFI